MPRRAPVELGAADLASVDCRIGQNMGLLINDGYAVIEANAPIVLG